MALYQENISVDNKSKKFWHTRARKTNSWCTLARKIYTDAYSFEEIKMLTHTRVRGNTRADTNAQRNTNAVRQTQGNASSETNTRGGCADMSPRSTSASASDCSACSRATPKRHPPPAAPRHPSHRDGCVESVGCNCVWLWLWYPESRSVYFV